MSKPISKLPRRVTSLGLVAVLSLITTVMGENLPHLNANFSPDAWPIDAFVLIDHHGKEFTQRRLEGRWTFVVFGDTQCAQPCEVSLATLARIAQRLAPTQALRTTQFLFVSVDPERDSVERLRDYVVRFDALLIGARGSRPTVKQLTEEMSVSYRLVDQRKGAAAPQLGATIHLIGPDSLLRAEFFPPYNAKALTAAYLRMRLGRRVP